jgi:hypothetical protein
MAKLALYDSERLVIRKVGVFGLMLRLLWRSWAFGFEIIPWGFLVFIGPLSVGFAHRANFLAAKNI